MAMASDMLTPYEELTLRTYAEHGTLADTAKALNRSESTVRNRLQQIRQKLGATSSLQAYYLLTKEQSE